jgi:hypothetical protein
MVASLSRLSTLLSTLGYKKLDKSGNIKTFHNSLFLARLSFFTASGGMLCKVPAGDSLLIVR